MQIPTTQWRLNSTIHGISSHPSQSELWGKSSHIENAWSSSIGFSLILDLSGQRNLGPGQIDSNMFEPDILLPEERKADKCSKGICPDSLETQWVDFCCGRKGSAVRLWWRNQDIPRRSSQGICEGSKKFSSKAAHGSSLPASTACSASGFLDNPNGSEQCKETWNQACIMPQTWTQPVGRQENVKCLFSTLPRSLKGHKSNHVH
jgi:hypothetical protein